MKRDIKKISQNLSALSNIYQRRRTLDCGNKRHFIVIVAIVDPVKQTRFQYSAVFHSRVSIYYLYNFSIIGIRAISCLLYGIELNAIFALKKS